MEQIVRPGLETGVFYLVLGGLEFDADWRDLRDFARSNNIDVEHAEVYPNSQGGWLRILDRQSFLRAFEVFNGARIRKNPMLAFADNETQPTALMYPPPMMRRPLPHQNHGLADTSPPAYMVAGAPYTLATPSALIPRQYVMPVQQVQFQQYTSSQGTSVQYDGMQPYICSQILPLGEPEAISNEARKVIVTQLPNNMTSALLREVLDWIMKGCAFNHPDSIESISIPKHRDGRPRSHAFIIMRSHKLAKFAEKELDGYVYYGKKLEARLTKEGAGPSPSSRTARKSKTGASSSSNTSSTRQSGGSSKSHSNSSGRDMQHVEPPQPKVYSTPLVVNGSGSDSSYRSRR